MRFSKQLGPIAPTAAWSLVEPSYGSLAGRAVSGSVLAISCQAAKVLTQVATTAVLARLLAPSDFGLVAMAGTGVAFLSLFSDLGLSTATIRREVLTEESLDTLFVIGMAASIAVAAISFALSPLVAWFYGDWRVAVLLAVQAIGIPIAAAGTQHAALLSRRMSWVRLHLAGVGAQLASSGVAIALAISIDRKYMAPVAQGVTSAAFLTLAYWRLCGWRPRLRVTRGAGSDVRFGLDVTASAVLNYFHRQFDNVLIGWRYGATDLGFYSRAYGLLSLPLGLVNGSLTQAAIPVLSRMEPMSERWLHAFMSLLMVSAWGGVGLCAVCFAGAEPIVAIVLGPQWHPSARIFEALSVASALSSASNGCGWTFLTLGKTRQMVLFTALASPLYVAAFAAGLPWGALGVAVAYSGVMAIVMPVYVVYVSRVAGIRLSSLAWAVVPPLVAFLVSVAVANLALRAFPMSTSFGRLTVGSGTSAAVFFAILLFCVVALPAYGRAREAAVAFARRG